MYIIFISHNDGMSLSTIHFLAFNFIMVASEGFMCSKWALLLEVLCANQPEQAP